MDHEGVGIWLWEDHQRSVSSPREGNRMATGRLRTRPRTWARPRARKRRASARVVHLSVAERVARGKAARKEVPRADHAVFEPPSSRADPVELLERQAKTRVPELVPIRYGRMLVSPFTFYRGAALIMANDLASTPRSGLTVQCCGDAHLSNFGVFASPERRLVFDVNDFDETLPGPWEWDVKRLGGEHADRGARQRLSPRSRTGSCSTRSAATAPRWREFAGDEEPRGVVRAPGHRERARGVRLAVQAEAGQASRRRQLAKARTKDSMTAFSKLTDVVDGEAADRRSVAADRADRPARAGRGAR